MTKRLNKEEKLAKIQKRCIELAEIVSVIKPIYKKSDADKHFIETIIGAGLWYIPSLPKNDSDIVKISQKAYKSGKICEDHVFPRKQAAKELLTSSRNLDLYDRFVSSYSEIYYITPTENRELVKYQKDETFNKKEMKKKYSLIGMIEIKYKQLKEIKNKKR